MTQKAGNNNFTVLLDALGVGNIREYARKMYEEHPHKNNMFGLSRMLSVYHIPNKGAMIKNVNDKDNASQTYKKYSFDFMSEDVISEQAKHVRWCADNYIQSTHAY